MSWGRKKARFNISLARMPRLWRLQGKNELIFSSISQSHHMACFCGTSGLSSAIHCWQGVALLLLSSPSASHWYFGHTCVRYFGTAVVICCVQPLYRNNAPLFSCLFLQHRGQPVMLFGAHHCKTSFLTTKCRIFMLCNYTRLEVFWLSCACILMVFPLLLDWLFREALVLGTSL